MFAAANTRQEEIKQKLALLDDPDRVVSNPYLNEPHAHNVREDVHDVRWMVWFPIPLGRGSPWEPSAQSLGDFHKESKHWPLYWMLQLILLGLENHDLGTPSFAINQKKNPALWKRTIEAYAGYRYLNDRRKETVDLIKTFVRRSPMFDPAVTEMLEAAKKTVRDRANDREQNRNNSNRNNNDRDADYVDPELRGNVPARRGNESLAEHQVNIEMTRIIGERTRRIAVVRAEHPEWSANEAQAFVLEEERNQERRETDRMFQDMFEDDFGDDQDVEGVEDMELILNEEPGDLPVEDGNDVPARPEGARVHRPEQVEDEVDLAVARQMALQQLEIRDAEQRRVEDWCQTLPGITRFHVYGGQLANATMDGADQRHALATGPREQGDAEHLMQDGVADGLVLIESDFLPWPLTSCLTPPVADISNVLGDGLERSFRDAVDIFSRMCNAEPKAVCKLFLFDGERPEEKHLLLGIAIRDNIEFDELIRNVEASIRHRKAREKTGNHQGRRGFSAWDDPYSHLARHKSYHPAFTYSNSYYTSCCTWFMEAMPNKEALDRREVSNNPFSDPSDKFHPSQVATLEFALAKLRRAKAKLGGLTEKDFMTAIRGGEGGREMRYIFHTPPRTTSWTFHPLQMFYDHPRFLGLGQTRWPHLQEEDDLMMQIITGQVKPDRERGLVNVNKQRLEAARANEEAAAAEDCLASTNPNFEQEASRLEIVVDKQRLLRSMPNLLPYRHGDVLVHFEAEHKVAWRKVEALLPEDPVANPEQYKVYCDVVDEYFKCALNKFCSIWRTDGVVDHLPTNASHKAVMLYGHELLNPRTNPKRSVTCHLPMFDPDMTPWGNSVVSKMLLLGKGCTIINCRIPFLAGGLLMTFDRDRPGKPRPNIQLCGPADVGKTFPFLDFIKSNYIAKTWDDQHRASAKSKNIHTHFPPQMLLCDEPPKWVTDSKAEDKYYEDVQQMKNQLVSGEHTYSVFTTIEHNGENIRTTDDVKTKDPRTLGFCTNQPRDKENPLGSRFLMISVPRPTKPPEDYQYDAGKLFPDNVRKFFHTEQFLLVEVMTAARIGVLPDLDMWLFKLVMRRFVSILRSWNVLDPRKGYRPIQIIEPFVRYESEVRAIVCARHVPGGVLYDKPYDPRDVQKIAPYRFNTLEIIKNGINMCREELIDEDARIVASAFCKHCKYDPTLTPLENYEKQLDDSKMAIPWRLHRNGKYDKSNPNNNEAEFLINLNEITMYGRIDTIAQTLAPKCQGLSAKQVAKVLIGLTKRSIRMRNNKRYINCPPNYIKDVIRGGTITDEETGEVIQMTEEVMMDKCGWVPAATFNNQDDRDGRLTLNPSLLWVLQDDVIERAWLLATMHAQYPRGKFISGRIMEDHPDLFEVDIYTDESILNYCQLHDSLHPDAPMPRSKGIAMNHRSKLTNFEQDVLMARILDPTNVEFHRSIFRDICENRAGQFVEVANLELAAAQRAAHNAGDRSGIYYTDEKVIELYEAYMEAHPELERPETDLRYPSNIVKQREAAEKEWDRNHKQMATTFDILGQLAERNIRFTYSMDEQEKLGRIRRSTSALSLSTSNSSNYSESADPHRSRDVQKSRKRLKTTMGVSTSSRPAPPRSGAGRGRVTFVRDRISGTSGRGKRVSRARRTSGHAQEIQKTPDHGGPQRLRRALETVRTMTRQGK